MRPVSWDRALAWSSVFFWGQQQLMILPYFFWVWFLCLIQSQVFLPDCEEGKFHVCHSFIVRKQKLKSFRGCIVGKTKGNVACFFKVQKCFFQFSFKSFILDWIFFINLQQIVFWNKINILNLFGVQSIQEEFLHWLQQSKNLSSIHSQIWNCHLYIFSFHICWNQNPCWANKSLLKNLQINLEQCWVSVWNFPRLLLSSQ